MNMSNFSKQGFSWTPRILFKRSIYITCAVLLFAALVCAQESPDGHWEGSVPIVFDVNRQVAVSLDLSKNAKSEWVASMGMVADNATGLVVQIVKVNGANVSFVATELMMSKFDLILETSGILKGTISTPQGSAPVQFKRTGPAKVALIQASPAVSREFEGDWEGTLGGNAWMTFHFKNQPDKTVSATIDTSNAMAIPLNDVKQSGRSVEFGIKVANSSFQGTINQEGTEIAGKIIRNGAGSPMTLKRDPMAGTWKLNVAKSTIPPGPTAPKELTLVIRTLGDQVEFAQTGTQTDGSPISINSTNPKQGGVIKLQQGSLPEGLTTIQTVIDAYNGFATILIDGKQVLVRQIVISKDGKTMTIASKGIIENLFIFDKQ
jgi:hypothetical protein